MMAFNAAARESCIVRNELTTTPLQALTLLNNVAFVEAARFLAERMLKEPQLTEPSQRIEWAFRLITSRSPAAEEVNILLEDLQRFTVDFEHQPAAAQKLLQVGEKPCDPELKPTELAAYTLVANTLLNLDEAMSQN